MRMQTASMIESNLNSASSFFTITGPRTMPNASTYKYYELYQTSFSYLSKSAPINCAAV